MTLPKHKYLLTYRYSEMIYDLNGEFSKRFLHPITDRRTIEQKEHAARSGKQNIIEGVEKSETSKKGEIQLLGVALGSLEELIGDYEDYIRTRGYSIWSKYDPRVGKLRSYAYRLSNLGNLGHLGNLKERPVLPTNPEEAANLMLTMGHMATYLLTNQIKALKQKFIESGGFTENLYKDRNEYRNKKNMPS